MQEEKRDKAKQTILLETNFCQIQIGGFNFEAYMI